MHFLLDKLENVGLKYVKFEVKCRVKTLVKSWSKPNKHKNNIGKTRNTLGKTTAKLCLAPLPSPPTSKGFRVEKAAV